MPSSISAFIAVDGDANVIDNGVFSYDRFINGDNDYADMMTGALFISALAIFNRETNKLWMYKHGRQVCTAPRLRVLTEIIDRLGEIDAGDVVMFLDTELLCDIDRSMIDSLFCVAPAKANEEPVFDGFENVGIDRTIPGIAVYEFTPVLDPEKEGFAVHMDAFERNLNREPMTEDENLTVTRVLGVMETIWKKFRYETRGSRYSSNDGFSAFDNDYDDTYGGDEIDAQMDMIMDEICGMSADIKECAELVLDSVKRVGGLSKRIQTNEDVTLDELSKVREHVDAEVGMVDRRVDGVANQVVNLITEIPERIDSKTNWLKYVSIAALAVAIMSFICVLVR